MKHFNNFLYICHFSFSRKLTHIRTACLQRRRNTLVGGGWGGGGGGGMKVILFIHFHYIHRKVVTQLSPCMVKMDLTASIDRNQAVAGSETILAWRFKSRPRSRATLINSHNSAKILIRILYNFWFWKSIKSVLCDTDIALFRATTQLENYTLHICFPHEPVSVMRTVHYSMHACIIVQLGMRTILGCTRVTHLPFLETVLVDPCSYCIFPLLT